MNENLKYAETDISIRGEYLLKQFTIQIYDSNMQCSNILLLWYYTDELGPKANKQNKQLCRALPFFRLMGPISFVIN